MEKSSEKVHIRMLGGFSLEWNGHTVDDQTNRSLKVWSVLAYIIAHRNRPIPQKELLDSIWANGHGDEKQPSGAMKTLLFRLRKSLVPVFGEEMDVIISKKGACWWNPELECELDIELFEQFAGAAENKQLADADRAGLYRSALALYKGEFLPRLQDQPWTAIFSARLRALYLQTVRNFAELLHRMEMYAEMESVCHTALQMEDLDEKLYLCLLRALLGQGKHIVAMGHYESAVDVFHRKLGIQPSHEMREMYREIIKYQKEVESDLSAIIEDINAQSKDNGAFTCNFGFFQEAYRLTARQAVRDGICIHIVLLTLASADDKPLSLDVLNDAMMRLSEVMVPRLRRGDVITRYSGAQYLVLLPRSNYEDSLTVIERILSAYEKCRCARHVKANVKIQEMNLDIEEPLFQ